MRTDSSYFRILCVFACMMICGCGGRNTRSNVGERGEDKTVKDKLLDAGAALLQNKAPLEGFNVYLDGFHFYNGNMDAQMEAHHYVHQLSDDLYQAVIFDGTGRDAKIMGVEYIITAELFKGLPEEEKKLWHSHHYEVKSGALVAPGIPDIAEHELMEKLVSTYGKTIHTWHTDQKRSLPLGSPMIMMGFTGDGQLRPEFLAARDKRFGISTPEIKAKRTDIPVPVPDPMANAWEKGEIRQLMITDRADSSVHKHKGAPRKKQL